MKKLFIAALMIAAVGSSAFAADASKISYKVKTNFEVQFAEAENVHWTLGPDFSKATFQLNEETLEAFYNQNGELLGYSRKIDFKKLPAKAIQKIRKNYTDYTITDSIEFNEENGKKYYVSLENGNRKQILGISVYGEVTPYGVRK
jgi:opacity protein-like surface antigen